MVISGGQVICGGVLSCTVIYCVPVEILLQASRAVHVRTMVPVPLQPVSPSTLSEKLMMILLVAVQLSVAVAKPVSATSVVCSQEMVTFAGTVNTGAWVSVMTIVWMHSATFPHWSVASQ